MVYTMYRANRIQPWRVENLRMEEKGFNLNVYYSSAIDIILNADSTGLVKTQSDYTVIL